ncbi:hypothetical protein [Streptomyces niveus]|uniref:hypothetical protein n=1 Tax=Streptomyces niveus TaxID=193462 RepID=UPI001C3FE16E|nr:hypothetical protein [Streptomyces niveus]
MTTHVRSAPWSVPALVAPRPSSLLTSSSALRRGTDPAAEALRELFQELPADEQPLRRMGALVAGVRYPMPGP